MISHNSPDRYQNHELRTELAEAIDALQVKLLWKGQAYVENKSVGFEPVLKPSEGAEFDVVIGRVEVDEPDPNARPKDGRYPNMQYEVVINQDSRVVKQHGLWASFTKSAGLVDGRSRTITYNVYETGETFRQVVDVDVFRVEHVVEENVSLSPREIESFTRQLQSIRDRDVSPPQEAR